MFSKELQELDRNTVQYMIDEMQDRIDRQDEALVMKDETLQKQNQALEEVNRILSRKDLEPEEKEKLIQKALKQNLLK